MVRLIALVLLALLAYVPASLAAIPEIVTNPGMTTLSRLGKVSIDVHGKGCKQITNKFQTSDDLFIPFATKAEWESFLDYADRTNNIDVSPCPIAYGAWSYSGSCSATCGGGTILQTRSCTYTPTGQTLDCSYCGGECSQTVECNTAACAEWDRSCAAPAWNPRNNPATCGQSCTVTCIRDGVPVSGSQCIGTPPADYIASTTCAGCAPGSETTGSHTASCSAGGLSGSGTIYVDDVRDCNGNIIPGRGTWTGVSGCCVPGLENTRTQNVNGISVAGCNAPTLACDHPSRTSTGSHTASCGQGGLSGSGTIYVSDVRDCNGNILPGRGTWTGVSGCCIPGIPRTQSQSVYGIGVAGCEAPAMAACTTPWGSTVAHGSSVTAYVAAQNTIPWTSCLSQTRTCNNGSLSGSYTMPDCPIAVPDVPTPPAPTCTWRVDRKDVIPGRSCRNPPTTGLSCSCGDADIFDYANCTVSMSCR